MLLEDLREALGQLPFPSATEAETPARETILEARKLVGAAVVDDAFLVDCIATEIPRLRDCSFRGLAPFFTTPETGIRVAFGYWPPGSTARPHEHTAWTITAVCRNELDVKTFDRDESYKAKTFVPKNLFKANAGSVGFIYDPCIHEPLNATETWSLSLHVISPRDGEGKRDDDPLWATKRKPRELDDAYRSVLEARNRHDYVHLLATILATVDSPAARLTLANALAIASSGTRSHLGGARPDRADAPWRLARVHPELELAAHDEDGMVSLEAHTSAGVLDGLVVSDVAREALSFAAKTPLFDVRSLPGGLSELERASIAEALEETGFFTRVRE
jgi:hypothetical protein